MLYYKWHYRWKSRLFDSRFSGLFGSIFDYGAHIFHTSNKEVWDYINQFAEFNRYTNSPIAIYKNELYNLPFNLNTFSKMFNLVTLQYIVKKLDEERKEGLAKLNGREPQNLEEQAISLVGTTVYEKLIKKFLIQE